MVGAAMMMRIRGCWIQGLGVAGELFTAYSEMKLGKESRDQRT